MTNQYDEIDQVLLPPFLYGIQSDFIKDPEEIQHRLAGFKHTKGYKEAKSQLIKLLHDRESQLLKQIHEAIQDGTLVVRRFMSKDELKAELEKGE
jgi:hypothetical protein